MKIFVKTLKGTSFEIEVKPEDMVSVVKNNIQNSQGISVYPADQQILIHQGKILKDETTLDENKVSENSFIVIMLNKAKASAGGVSTSTNKAAPPASSSIPASPTPVSAPAISPAANPVTAPAISPAAALTSVPATAPTTTAAPPSATAALTEADVYGQAASNLVAGNNLEQTIQGILEMGGGTWDRDTVVRALRAAYNNPDRAIDYLYSGIPDQVDAPALAPVPAGTQALNPLAQTPESAPPAIPSSGPNTNPLDLFPQGIPNVGANAGAGSLDILRNSPQFRTLQAMVQANPQILQPMLQELAKQNPQIMRLIQEHQGEFLRLINEPAEGVESNLLGQLEGDAPQSVAVTQEESEAIERLEAMGFDRALVLEVFIACNRDEELAANYLLDHMHEFEEDSGN